ncbi:heme biosynthesis HemY N-terminal domain-containing protein [Neopusillimonas maritima]|uniref:Heme biosynthesis protein HemY n=1 Tax=Neopusillimonas maritima TaxID=2026239 RepID=A0A3A1YVX0_9BURK|nr:heme biosynthesis HemY N-terminal domain-containing protein [Neopusillimonas maritima]RIY41641.1 heme biosynthesis protein HemY [Neopusillimonas maritima]
MRAWFWMLLLLALAVGLGVVLREHSGNVLIIAQPWRIEMSLTLFALLLLAAFVVLYLLFRGLSWLLSGPERFREWRGLRARKRDHELLESGWLHVLEGRYPQAEQELSRLLGRTRSSNTRVLAGLALARACHQQGQMQRRDEALTLARSAVGTDSRLKESWATAVAEMYLDQHRAQEALTLLQPYQDTGAKHLNATRLLLQAHQQLNNADQVFELTRQLLRRGAIDKQKAQPLIAQSVAERLRAAGPEGFRSVWGELRGDEKTLPEIALAAAHVQQQAGHADEAGKILEAALNEQLEPRLLNAYSQAPADQVSRRINKAEGWLKSHPDSSALLAALGNLCLTGQLWGSGERYLLRSMAIRSDVRIHALLGNLYDRLGRQADAMKHWRLASGVAGVLPVLPGSTVLPAADTRGDPTLIDVQDLESSSTEAASFGEVPVAASAADYLESEESVNATDPAAASAKTSDPNPQDPDYHEYFDSAPIPGVDLSQTSDRPTRRGS